MCEYIELKNDFYTHSFNKEISNLLFYILKIKKCKFCQGELNPNEAKYYQHDGGWQLSFIKEKVWITFTCSKCHHQWSINYLGVSRKNAISIDHIIKKCSKCDRKVEEYDLLIDGEKKKTRNYKLSLSFGFTKEGMVCFKCLTNN